MERLSNCGSQPLWELLARLGTPARQFITQRSGGGPAHDIAWRCGCEAAGVPERIEWEPCLAHLSPRPLRA
ncbi:MAG: hypothetical protein NVSMB64_06610 [Candidatus Velthaea sp.]